MSASEAEERAQFTLAMRAKGVEDIELLRALERVPRALFMPQRFADISGRDIALPIGCGQTSPPPSIVAAMIAALDVRASDTVCEIGTGTGYCTALLAQFAKEVVSLDAGGGPISFYTKGSTAFTTAGASAVTAFQQGSTAIAKS